MKRKQMSFVLHRAILPEILAKTEGEISRHFEKEISRLQLSAREKKTSQAQQLRISLLPSLVFSSLFCSLRLYLTFSLFVFLNSSNNYYLLSPSSSTDTNPLSRPTSALSRNPTRI